jgi:predicted metal-dependent hydrolase
MGESLPPYQVRVSKRARSVRLSVTREKGLVVTIPFGFNPQSVPDILGQKADWIHNAITRLSETAGAVPPRFPDKLDLLAIQERWLVVYKPSTRKGVSIESQTRHVMVITGKTGSILLVKRLLHTWVRDRAAFVFPSWLERISRQTGLAYKGVTVRNQRTRWGSCSAQKTISLNQKLIFLPPHLVDYIMIHELCHTVHMSHSRLFWQLVAHYLPDYAERRKLLREYEKKIHW